jgi:hypothetical protein
MTLRLGGLATLRLDKVLRFEKHCGAQSREVAKPRSSKDAKLICMRARISPDDVLA